MSLRRALLLLAIDRARSYVSEARFFADNFAGVFGFGFCFCDLVPESASDNTAASPILIRRPLSQDALTRLPSRAELEICVQALKDGVYESAAQRDNKERAEQQRLKAADAHDAALARRPLLTPSPMSVPPQQGAAVAAAAAAAGPISRPAGSGAAAMPVAPSLVSRRSAAADPEDAGVGLSRRTPGAASQARTSPAILTMTFPAASSSSSSSSAPFADVFARLPDPSALPPGEIEVRTLSLSCASLFF